MHWSIKIFKFLLSLIYASVVTKNKRKPSSHFNSYINHFPLNFIYKKPQIHLRSAKIIIIKRK